MKDIGCPCYANGERCQRRTVNCHGSCQEYLAWADQRREEREAVQKRLQEEYSMDTYVRASIRRINHEKRTGKKE